MSDETRCTNCDAVMQEHENMKCDGCGQPVCNKCCGDFPSTTCELCVQEQDDE